MAAPEVVHRVHPHERVAADPTPVMVREQAITVDGLWSGVVLTDPGMMSGWHHHGDHDTSVYVVDGAVRVEFGPAGRQAVEAEPGDFVHVPKHVVHREGNPGATTATLVVTRAGGGPVTVNVDGPASASG